MLNDWTEYGRHGSLLCVLLCTPWVQYVLSLASKIECVWADRSVVTRTLPVIRSTWTHSEKENYLLITFKQFRIIQASFKQPVCILLVVSEEKNWYEREQKFAAWPEIKQAHNLFLNSTNQDTTSFLTNYYSDFFPRTCRWQDRYN